MPGPIIAEGREAELLGWGEGRVLKLMRDVPHPELRVELEERALTAAAGVGAPVPAPHGHVTHHGRPGLVMDRVDGPDLLSEVERRPWAVYSVARTVGTLHARLHGIEGPAELPDLKEWVRTRIAESELVPPALAQFAARELPELPDGDRLCHGDFHPANVLASADGAKVVDWTGATRGDPAADVARTRLILTLGALPENTPARTRLLAAVGRRALWSGYRRAYRQAAGWDAARVSRWQEVRAVERLAEGIDAERPALLRILERAGVAA